MVGLKRCQEMNEEDKRAPGIGSTPLPEPVVEQEVVIFPDGRLAIPWITPKATRLVLEVYRSVSDEPS
jgi:hypothetical protein